MGVCCLFDIYSISPHFIILYPEHNFEYFVLLKILEINVKGCRMSFSKFNSNSNIRINNQLHNKQQLHRLKILLFFRKTVLNLAVHTIEFGCSSYCSAGRGTKVKMNPMFARQIITLYPFCY